MYVSFYIGGVEPPRQLVTIHMPQWAFNGQESRDIRRELIVRAVADSSLENIRFQQSQGVLREMQARLLSADKKQYCQKTSEIREFLESLPEFQGISLDIEKLIKGREEAVKEQLDRVLSYYYDKTAHIFLVRPRVDCIQRSLELLNFKQGFSVILPGGILGAAVYANCKELVQFLCDAKPNISPQEDRNMLIFLSEEEGDGNTKQALFQLFEGKLFLAVQEGDVCKVNAFLKEKWFVKECSYKAPAFPTTMPRELVGRLREPGGSNRHFYTFYQALLTAAFVGNIEIMNILLEDIRQYNGVLIGKLLIQAVKNGIVFSQQEMKYRKEISLGKGRLNPQEIQRLEIEKTRFLETERAAIKVLNALLNCAKSQPSLLDEYIGEALMEVAAKKEGSGEVAKLLFAAGAGNSSYFDDAWAKACEIQNADFMNAFWTNVAISPEDIESQGLQAKPKQSCLATSKIREFLESLPEFQGSSLDIEKLVEGRGGEPWAEKVKEQFNSVFHSYYEEITHIFCTKSPLECSSFEEWISSKIPGGIFGAAVFSDKLELVQFLCDAKPNLSCRNGRTNVSDALVLATFHEKVEMVRIIGRTLLESSVYSEKDKESYFSYALSHASKRGNIEMMNILLKGVSKRSIGELFVTTVRHGMYLSREEINCKTDLSKKESLNGILEAKKIVVKDLNFFLNFVKSQQPSVLDDYIGEALIGVAQEKGSREMAELLFAAGAKNNSSFDDAWAKACEVQNADFINVFRKM